MDTPQKMCINPGWNRQDETYVCVDCGDYYYPVEDAGQQFRCICCQAQFRAQMDPEFSKRFAILDQIISRRRKNGNHD